MDARELAVTGSYHFVPEVFPDERGKFTSPYQRDAFVEAVGVPLFPVAQGSFSRSRQGVARGVHFTSAPPGGEKYVYCPQGRVLDIVVDLRVGSPTFGRWDAVVLDEATSHAVYFPIGAGHAFVALTEDAVMCYLLSAGYDPKAELAVSILDKDLRLPVPPGDELIRSDRDRAAPSLAQAMAAGILPDYAQCTGQPIRTSGT